MSRHLVGKEYLAFLLQYLKLFKQVKKREKIIGPFKL